LGGWVGGWVIIDNAFFRQAISQEIQ